MAAFAQRAVWGRTRRRLVLQDALVALCLLRLLREPFDVWTSECDINAQTLADHFPRIFALFDDKHVRPELRYDVRILAEKLYSKFVHKCLNKKTHTSIR